jgi:hypothetical protein
MSEVTHPVTDPSAASKSTGGIFLVSYPKVIFLYPTFLVALAAGIYMSIWGGDPLETTHRGNVIMGAVFLWTFTLNLIVFSFEFPRGASLTLLFFIAALGLGLYLLFETQPDVLPILKSVISAIRPLANAAFYFVVATVLGLVFLTVMVKVQFDYWEVRANELLHHHGFMSDLERYPAPNLRITKEINDVFEFMLFRSGRLILHPSNEPRSIVLENVPFITQKEEQLTRMLGALQVQVRTDA